MSTEQLDVLVVEDDTSLASGLLKALRDKELSLDFADNVTEARRLLSRKDYKVALVDLLFPEGSGFEVIEFIKSEGLSGMSVIVITAADPNALRDLDRSIVKTVLFKPLDLSQLAAYVHLLSLQG